MKPQSSYVGSVDLRAVRNRMEDAREKAEEEERRRQITSQRRLCIEQMKIIESNRKPDHEADPYVIVNGYKRKVGLQKWLNDKGNDYIALNESRKKCTERLKKVPA